MDNRVWRAYLGGAVVAAAAYPFLPAGGWARPLWQVGLGISAAVAIAVGLRQCRPGTRAAWWCCAVGVAGHAAGAAVEAYSTGARAGVGYLTLYPAVGVGLMLLLRRQTTYRDRPALLDTTAVAAVLGLLAWVFAVRPAVGAEPAALVGDVVLVALAVRLQFGAGARRPVSWLMTGAFLAFLAGDLANVPHIVAYVLLGAAALHPSARGVGEPVPPGPARVGRGRLAVLAGVALTAPLLLLAQAVRGEVTDALAIAVVWLVVFALLAMRMVQQVRALERQTSRMRELSRTDELTGLPNRRGWTAELPRAIERARRAGAPLSVAMLDLDRFARFNEVYGPQAGDRLLKTAAATWRSQVRAVDLLGRGEGDAFVLLLPGADDVVGGDVVERLREVTPLGETASVGLASWDGDETSDELVARAEAALQAAKLGGRNRVTVAVAGFDPRNFLDVAAPRMA